MLKGFVHVWNEVDSLKEKKDIILNISFPFFLKRDSNGLLTNHNKTCLDMLPMQIAQNENGFPFKVNKTPNSLEIF